MPLTDYQARVARLLSENRSFDSYLAGGAAILIEQRDWLAALGTVEPFVAARSAEEIGCLYYSASRRAFVDPRLAADARPHFGRPGGVLPQVSAHGT